MSVKLPVDGTGRASPITGQSARVIQEYGHVVQMPLAFRAKLAPKMPVV